MRYLVSTLILLLATSAFSQNKERVNAVITSATWISIQSDEGGDEFSPRVSAEDRQCITDLRNAFHKWGHYRVANRPQDAELIFVVHCEGGSVIPDPGRTLTRGDAGDNNDTLFVYNANQYPNGGALWRAGMNRGLASPKLPLFELFKEQAEQASKKKTSKP